MQRVPVILFSKTFPKSNISYLKLYIDCDVTNVKTTSSSYFSYNEQWAKRTTYINVSEMCYLLLKKFKIEKRIDKFKVKIKNMYLFMERRSDVFF